MIPSDLSEFNLYGGIYRHLNLVYVPLVSLERVHVTPARHEDGTWSAAGAAQLWSTTSPTLYRLVACPAGAGSDRCPR